MDKKRSLQEFGNYNRIIYIETETDGIDYHKNRIIRFESVLWEQGLICDAKGFLLKLPEEQILSDTVSQMVGITNEELSTTGRDRDEAEIEIVNFLFQQNTLICSFHAEFHLKFIYEILSRQGKEKLFDICDYLDLLTISRDKYESCRSLTQLALMLQITPSKECGMDMHRILEYLNQTYDDIGQYINWIGRYSSKFAKDKSFLPKIKYGEQQLGGVGSNIPIYAQNKFCAK